MYFYFYLHVNLGCMINANTKATGISIRCGKISSFCLSYDLKSFRILRLII